VAQSTFTGFFHVCYHFFRLISIPLGSPFFPGFEPYSKNQFSQCIDELLEFSDRSHFSWIDGVPSYFSQNGDVQHQKSCLVHLSACFQQKPSHGSFMATPAAPGTSGHPAPSQVCRRPCIYFLAGHCANGNQCTYCHLPHEEPWREHDGLGDLDQW